MTRRRAGPMRGQALAEYLLLLAVLVVLFSLPFDGPGSEAIPGTPGRSVAARLADSLRAAYQSLTYFLSLP